jgi:hypothetical protein
MSNAKSPVLIVDFGNDQKMIGPMLIETSNVTAECTACGRRRKSYSTHVIPAHMAYFSRALEHFTRCCGPPVNITVYANIEADNISVWCWWPTGEKYANNGVGVCEEGS